MASKNYPRSHKHGLMVSVTPKRGLHVYFQKKPSAFNECVGNTLRGAKSGSRANARDHFGKAAFHCADKARAKAGYYDED